MGNVQSSDHRSSSETSRVEGKTKQRWMTEDILHLRENNNRGEYETLHKEINF